MSKSKSNLYRNHPSVNKIDWKWKRWDVRSDGKVFWQYGRYGEYWVTWETAIRTQQIVRKSMRKTVSKNKEHYRKLNAEWRNKNREKHCENSRIWGKLNRGKCSANKRKRDNERRKNEPLYLIRGRIRSRLLTAMRNGGYTKKSTANEILGADYAKVSAHLESQFKDGMSWENRSEWHIDHIIPLASAKNEDELIKLFHYTNLQPLWAIDNLRKGAIIQSAFVNP